MGKVIVNVEVTDNNYSAYIDILPGCVGTGENFDQLKNNMEEAVAYHLEISREFGDTIASVFEGKYELVYRFDPKSLLTHYRGIFTNSALERLTGINQRQLQRYASGASKPRREQAEKIALAFNRLGKELQVIAL